MSDNWGNDFFNEPEVKQRIEAEREGTVAIPREVVERLAEILAAPPYTIPQEDYREARETIIKTALKALGEANENT